MTEKKMVTVTIDGHAVEVEEGTPLIAATEKAGKHVPRFCYHSHLSVAGNCRMCVVEVEGARGLPISCATPCTDGMVAKTDTEPVRKHRASVMEFLLVNHPIDCPICDQAGECSLQVYYMAHDLKDSRLEVDKVEYGKRMPVGPRVLLDQERCVECTRCIRFCDEVTGTGELRMMNRGDREVIDTFPGFPLDNPYSVNTADICPVGALTQTDFRFKARVWFLKEQDTICPGCSRGCNVQVAYGWHDIVTDHNGIAYRLKPRVNDEVNKAWMCDFGREEYRQINEDRVAGASLGGEAVPTDRAVASARAALSGAGSEVLFVGSLASTLEELHLLRKLAEAAGATAVAVADKKDGLEDDFLIKADKHPNRQGAVWLDMLRDPGDLPMLLAGKQAVVIHRADLLALDEDGAVRRALEAVPLRIVVAANSCATTSLATHVLPGCSYLERTGHWVNVDGRVQRVQKGRYMRLRQGAEDDLVMLSQLSEDGLPSDPKEVFASLVLATPRLAGLTWAAVGKHGVHLRAEHEGARS